MSSVDMIFFLTVILGLKAVSSQILGGDLEEGDECRPLGGGQGTCILLSQCKTLGDFKKNHPPICSFKGPEPIVCCPPKVTAKVESVQMEKEGGECKPLGGGQGTCTLLSQCKTLGDFKKNQPPICSFKGLEPIVCCPKKMESGQKVAQACTELDRCCRKNLDLEGNVVGGTESAPRQHPYMVLILFGTTTSQRCGGSLITARFVLSAAHCSFVFPYGPAKWARLGELDINSTSEDANPVDKTIIERILHPNYKTSSNYHDIALFKLDSDVQFNRYITPICLNTLRDIETNFTTVVGWGMTAFGGPLSQKLREAKVEIYDDSDCKRLMFSSFSTRTSRGHDADQMLCAGVPDGSRDACTDDSGGPLYVLNRGNCTKIQVGITSYGNECGVPNSPGVYTRVSNYISWIEEVAFGDGTVIKC